MSSTNRVQKKIQYYSNMHDVRNEPAYDSIQSNLPPSFNQDVKSRQSVFVNMDKDSKQETLSKAHGFTFEKSNPTDQTNEIFNKNALNVSQNVSLVKN
jgi:hypothetical protein